MNYFHFSKVIDQNNIFTSTKVWLLGNFLQNWLEESQKRPHVACIIIWLLKMDALNQGCLNVFAWRTKTKTWWSKWLNGQKQTSIMLC